MGLGITRTIILVVITISFILKSCTLIDIMIFRLSKRVTSKRFCGNAWLFLQSFDLLELRNRKNRVRFVTLLL